MKLTNEFTVSADRDTVWKTLLDMEGVAGCLPGATIKATDDPGVYEGTMKVKMGPMSVNYQGVATLTEVDEEAHRAVISLRAREARGQGTAMATITNNVESAAEGTRVVAETDLHVTGAQARFGRGVMEDVAGRIMKEFSSRLERKLAGEEEAPAAQAGAPAAAGAGAAAAPPPRPPAKDAGADDALDMGALLSQSAVGRYAKIAVPALLGLLVLLKIVRR